MPAKAILLAFIALSSASPVAAETALTVRPDESWIFSISGGHPVRARKAGSATAPREGEVLVTVRSMMGTTMTITSNNRVAYSYRAELVGVGGGKTIPARACTLPANGKIAFEHWPEQAKAVRLSTFRRAGKDGSCP